MADAGGPEKIIQSNQTLIFFYKKDSSKYN